MENHRQTAGVNVEAQWSICPSSLCWGGHQETCPRGLQIAQQEYYQVINFNLATIDHVMMQWIINEVNLEFNFCFT